MRIHITHSFDCPPDTLWTLLLDEEVNARLYQLLEMKERTVLEQSEEAGTLRRRIRYVPKQDLPAVVKKLFSGELAYVEETVYRRADSTMDVHVVPNVLSDKISFRGVVRVRPLDGGRSERELDAEVSVNVLMVGGTVEKHIAETVRTSYETAAAELRRLIAARR